MATVTRRIVSSPAICAWWPRSPWGIAATWLPISEVISEGNVGLMQAVKRFEPDKGFRLATYAMWWIKAAIQGYILRSWSLVKMEHHRQPEEAVLQPAQGQEPHLGAGGG